MPNKWYDDKPIFIDTRIELSRMNIGERIIKSFDDDNISVDMYKYKQIVDESIKHFKEDDKEKIR